jgi:hypothetical protein
MGASTVSAFEPTKCWMKEWKDRGKRNSTDTCIACLAAASPEMGTTAYPESEVLQEALGEAYCGQISVYFSSARPVPH